MVEFNLQTKLQSTPTLKTFGLFHSRSPISSLSSNVAEVVEALATVERQFRWTAWQVEH
jgi:hypothetical protein